MLPQEEEIDWMDNKLPIYVLSFNSENLIPDSDILLTTAWQTAEFVERFSDSKGKKFYFVQHHESLWLCDASSALSCQ